MISAVMMMVDDDEVVEMSDYTLPTQTHALEHAFNTARFNLKHACTIVGICRTQTAGQKIIISSTKHTETQREGLDLVWIREHTVHKQTRPFPTTA